MKLRQRLKTGDIVKIGFIGDDDKASGSGFIFCGQIDGAARAYISKKSTEERKRLKAELKRCESLSKTKPKYVEDAEFYRSQCGKADFKAFKVTRKQQDIYCKKYKMPCLEAIESGKCKQGGKDEVRDE